MIHSAESWKDFAAGVVGGMAGILVGQPFDVARVSGKSRWSSVLHVSRRVISLSILFTKVRLQTQTIGHSVHYSGMFNCMSQMLRTEGAGVFYRGIMPPLLAVAGVNSLLFGSYGSLRRCVQSDPATLLTLPQIGFCGKR